MQYSRAIFHVSEKAKRHNRWKTTCRILYRCGIHSTVGNLLGRHTHYVECRFPVHYKKWNIWFIKYSFWLLQLCDYFFMYSCLHRPCKIQHLPSSCNFLLQQRQPCEPIREQNLNPSAIWLDGTVLALATGWCKNLEKRCTYQNLNCKPKRLCRWISLCS